MKLLVLAAGYGTRLKELGEATPKALLPINGKPLLSFILDRTKNLMGLNEIIVVTNDKFYTQFLNWSKQEKSVNAPITVVNDRTLTAEDRLGSIGDIQFVLDNVKVNDDLLVVGGDNLFDFNLEEYFEFAKNNTNSVSIGLFDIHNKEDAKKFGVVNLDKNNTVTLFEEKPQNPKSTLIAMCFYYLPKSTLACVNQYLAEVKKSDTAGDYIRWLLENGKVYGFQFSGSWYDIGSIEAYNEAKVKFKA